MYARTFIYNVFSVQTLLTFALKGIEIASHDVALERRGVEVAVDAPRAAEGKVDVERNHEKGEKVKR